MKNKGMSSVRKKIIVDISDAKVSRNSDDVIVTYSLGSCIGVALYDSVARLGGMLHYQLPESKIDKEKAQKNPFMFADTGMSLLINKLIELGAIKKRIKVKICGGASMQGSPKGFDIGNRNHLAIRKILWKNGMFIDKEHIGGNAPRNMYLDIESGVVSVKCGATVLEL